MMDGLNYAVVGAAPAQVTAQAFANLLRGPLRSSGRLRGGDRAGHAPLELAQHADRRAQLPRRAVAALKTVLLDEGCLQWVQDIAVRQALDGHDLAAVRLHRQGQAGVDTLTVQQHGTGAACALVAAL